MRHAGTAVASPALQRARRKPNELLSGIEFPANPFVALADLLLVLLLVFALGFAALKIGDESVYERIAVETMRRNIAAELQQEILSSPDPEVRAAWGKHIAMDYEEGDLQRWWLDGKYFYPNGDTRVTARGPRRLLVAIGKVLKRYQGNPYKPGSGYFKRVGIEGHSDLAELPPVVVGKTAPPTLEEKNRHYWALSLARAEDASRILQQESGVHSRMLEISGRGCWWEKRPHPKDEKKPKLLPENRRVEIVIIYSPEGAATFLKRGGNAKP